MSNYLLSNFKYYCTLIYIFEHFAFNVLKFKIVRLTVKLLILLKFKINKIVNPQMFEI